MLYSKWEDKGETVMIGHVKDVYKGVWANWTTSALPAGLPSTNNGIEGINGRYKMDGTLRKRSEFAAFAEDTSAWVHKKSTNDAGLPAAPLVRVATWQLAHLAKYNSFTFAMREDAVRVAGGNKNPPSGSSRRWLVPSQKLINSLTAPALAAKKRQLFLAAAKFLKLLENPSAAPNFDFITNMCFNFYCLEPLHHARGHMNFSCTCPQYAKRVACHHSLALGIQESSRSQFPNSWKEEAGTGSYCQISSSVVSPA